MLLPFSIAALGGQGVSFDSLRNVFLHLTVVEKRWISYIVPDRYSD